MIGGLIGLPIGGVLTGGTAAVALSSKASSMFFQKTSTLASTALPGKINSQFYGKVQGGVNLPSKITSQFKSRAPGGILISAVSNFQFKARAPGGVALPAACTSQFKSTVGNGVVLKGIAKVQLTMLDSVFVKRQVNSDRLPLFLKSGPSFWKGRNG